MLTLGTALPARELSDDINVAILSIGKVSMDTGTDHTRLVRVTTREDAVAKLETIAALAWLNTVCRASNRRDEIMYCSAGFTLLDNGVLRIFHATSSMTQGSAATATDDYSTSIEAQANSGWYRHVKFRQLLVVARAQSRCRQKYPIARRRPQERGLEVNFNVMALLSQAHRATVFDRVLVLKGFCSMLVAAAQVGQLIMCHYLQGSNSIPVRYSEAVKYSEQAGCVGFGALDAPRHFLGWTQYADSHIRKAILTPWIPCHF